MSCKVVHQSLRHRVHKSLSGGRTIVPRITVKPDLVLHLHHHHSLLARINLTYMSHHSPVGGGISIAGVGAERTQNRQLLALRSLGQRIALAIQLDIKRLVAAHSVLPASEPQQAEFQVVLPGLGDDAVHTAEIVLALLWLNHLPGHHGKGSVHSCLLEGLPVRSHILGARRRRVAKLAGKREKRLAFDYQLGDFAPLFKMGCGILAFSDRGAAAGRNDGGGA